MLNQKTVKNPKSYKKTIDETDRRMIFELDLKTAE